MRASTWWKLNLMANKYTLTLFCCLTQVILIKACEHTKAFVFRYNEKWTLILLVCRWRHSGHLGDQEQKHFSSLGSNLYFHVNYSRKQFYCTDSQNGPLVMRCNVILGEEKGLSSVLIGGLLRWLNVTLLLFAILSIVLSKIKVVARSNYYRN